jgi:hypothetical protein
MGAGGISSRYLNARKFIVTPPVPPDLFKEKKEKICGKIIPGNTKRFLKNKGR